MISKIKKFNSKVALVITKMVGTMWCAYAFTILALISLPQAILGGTATLVSWIAQTFLQLILLSIIMVGQDVISQKTEARAEEDHFMLMDELQEIKEMHKDLHKLLQLDTEF